MNEQLSDEQIGQKIQDLELEEYYIRDLLVSLGCDPARGFTSGSLAALENATLEERRRSALRTLAVAPEENRRTFSKNG
jgi:hypothetical protein